MSKSPAQDRARSEPQRKSGSKQPRRESEGATGERGQKSRGGSRHGNTVQIEAAGSGTRHRMRLAVHPDVALDQERLRQAAIEVAGVDASTAGEVVIERRGIDARGRKVRLDLELSLYSKNAPVPERELTLPELAPLRGATRVAIVGAGPAGLFCAYRLAQRGVPCIVFERGKVVSERRHDLAALSREGTLDPDSNYCFGEGGAGTFSDGKLYTRSGKRGSVAEVLRILARHGAPEDILVDRRPHIGTNRLPKVISSIRRHLQEAGVAFAFGTRVEGLLVESGRVCGVRLAGRRTLRVPRVVVAAGHSAPDVLNWLAQAGARIDFKPFAAGVRIEHPQRTIDQIQFGELAGHPALGAAAYRLVERVDGRGVYSFCMCPGGFIVPAATQPGQQVVNGMSPAVRRGGYANSGFVTEIGREDVAAAGFDAEDPMCGLHYLARLERAAYEAGGGNYVAPGQRLIDFIRGRASADLPSTSYHRGLESADLHPVLREIAAPIRGALMRLGEKMPTFLDHDAIAVGVESRTSSPVQVPRDRQSLETHGLGGLYACGEGAGYAGGIVSAAIDGMRVAELIAGPMPQARDERAEFSDELA